MCVYNCVLKIIEIYIFTRQNICYVEKMPQTDSFRALVSTSNQINKLKCGLMCYAFIFKLLYYMSIFYFRACFITFFG